MPADLQCKELKDPVYQEEVSQHLGKIEGKENGVSSKIALARNLYQKHSQDLLSDKALSEMLIQLDQKIEATQKEMATTGVVAECADCAVQGEGTCCSERTGHKPDITLLLINLLIGKTLPDKAQSTDLCYFLTNRGCSLRARPILCVNFVCSRLREKIPHKVMVHLQQTAGYEMDILFGIEAHIKLMAYY